MRRDPIVLGQNYILSGSDVGKKRPNANAIDPSQHYYANLFYRNTEK